MADKQLKTIYFGFALDPVSREFLVYSVGESHADVIENTAALAGNKLQTVIASDNIAKDLQSWLLRNGVPKHAVMDLLRGFADGLRDPDKIPDEAIIHDRPA